MVAAAGPVICRDDAHLLRITPSSDDAGLLERDSRYDGT